jgi:hypothetical protein
LDYARKSGAEGAQPSNYMLHGDKGFKTAKEIKDTFAKAKLKLDGVSAHCPFWVSYHCVDGQYWHPSVPAGGGCAQAGGGDRKSGQKITFCVCWICALSLGIKVVPMFWAVAFGWELATGYPWGFWKGAIMIC